MSDPHNRLQTSLDTVMEATKLTKAGRLHEATVLLQRSLMGDSSPPDHPESPDPSKRLAGPKPIPDEGVQAGFSSLFPERLRDVVSNVAQTLGRGLAPALKGLHGTGSEVPPKPANGTFVERSFSGVAGTRSYKLFVPARGGRDRPVVVMLHGCGQSPDDFAAGTAMNRVAEAEGIVVVYPAQSLRAHAQKCWNWYQPADQERGSGEAGIIAGLTQAIVDETGADPRRVYIAGLSAGAAAAANVARAYPDVYAALGVHSGLAAGCAGDMTAALTAMRLGALAVDGVDVLPAHSRVPTIVFHGENDSTVHPRNGDQILAQAGTDALRAQVSDEVSPGGLPYTRTRYSDAEGRVLVENWTVRGLAHAWSGGDPSGSYADRRGPDASQAMVAFFREHRLDPRRH